jgi:integrase
VCKVLRELGSTATPHQLRHWYATAPLSTTGNLRVVQEMMRHASPGGLIEIVRPGGPQQVIVYRVPRTQRRAGSPR